MEKRENQNYILPLCAAFFALALIIAVLVGRIAVTDMKYMTVSPDFSMLSFGESIKYTAECAASSAVQMLILYIAGFSTLSAKAAYAVAGYRGAALGTACSFIGKGSVSFSRGSAYGIAGGINIPEFLPPVLLYVASTVIIFAAAAFSSAYSKEVMTVGDAEKQRNIGTLRYTVFFLIFAGASSLLDAARLLFA